MFGLVIKDLETKRYTNSILSTSGHRFDKRHLVPFGEYFPFRNLAIWLKELLLFPVSDVTTGSEHQPPFYAAGQLIGPSICFEIAYPSEIRKSLPQATLLVNMSDDAFVSHTIEPYQQHQIARMRALESARFLVRAVNSGFSALIGPKGNVIARTSLHEKTVLTGEVQPLQGITPYVYFGDWPLLGFACALPLFFYIRQRRLK